VVQHRLHRAASGGFMTASAMSQATMQPAGYAAWIADVKLRIRAAQQRAALAVNKELLQLYWQIGRDILDRQAEAGWGTGILSQIEADLRVEFPEMRGFSQTNLKYMRMFAEAWPDPSAVGQRFVDQLPWGQNITLLTKLKTREERLLYAARAVEHGWSRPLLTHHIELRTLEREG
jgi:predicted nuclease of restriction endonuclease-like (RecB) superfamily